MTATWALVFMLCSSRCEPQYAINYSSRGECVRAIPKQEGMVIDMNVTADAARLGGQSRVRIFTDIPV